MRSILKIISINILMLFILFNALLWLICAANSIYYVFARSAPNDNSLVNLPHYAHVNWVMTYLREVQLSEIGYVSFIEWRSKPFSGTAINILPPYGQRRTVGHSDPDKPTVYFFGGSTVWGAGVDDASTIPSQFTQLSGFASENFGETGYTAHQSLVLLIQLLQDGRRPDIVVFYDGGNDVSDKCRSELTPWSHEQEAKITSALESYRKRKSQYGLSYLIRPLQMLAEQISTTHVATRRNTKSKFNCHTDLTKAEKIAENLIRDWMMAKMLVESYNGKFLGILQPVSYFSHTKDPAMSSTHKEQFEAVYPIIKKKMSGIHGLYDLTDALNKDEYIYTDFAHLGPAGNEYIADEVFKILRNVGQPAAYSH